MSAWLVRFILSVEDTSLPFLHASLVIFIFAAGLSCMILTTSWKKIPLYCPFKIMIRAFLKFYPEKENITFARFFLVIRNFKALEFRAWSSLSLKQLGPCSVSFVSSAAYLPQLSMISRESSCDIFQNFTSLPVHGCIKGYPKESASIPFLSVQ